ncbi:NLR family CARD domain-containing protein 3-like isoform X2 [Anguilla anguilla]|uniref:NLR family CARD domain-containing protein 3-like isoform X2 n=1 Tax=Anguilla anguilla TaxID=7936 RepID=UPI0015A84E93|nr:NLR family CARD domain-containing protein 3-like isoform X2 [Anguilla anguilla]
MSLLHDHEEGLPASEMSWTGEEEGEVAPERNIFLLLGETSPGTMGRKRLLDDRPPSPAPSYESMKSDVRSDDDISDYSEELCPTVPRIQLDRPDSRASSCSEESDVSGECPVEPFWMGPRPKVRKTEGSKCSTLWVPLDKAEVKVQLGITEQRHPAMNLPFMSKALHATLEKLEEDERRYFRKCLVGQYPQIFESSLLEYKVLDLVDKMLERCDMEGSLKITLLILDYMKLKETAKFLQRMCKRNEMQYELKASMKKKYTFISEGLAKQDNSTLLNSIYTDLVITDAGNGSINTEHEVKQIGKMVETKSEEFQIKCRDLFTSLGGYMKHHRFLLMKGMAGTGKSVCVQKFILDWAEGEGHQDMYFVFPIPFNELNSLKSEEYSLIQLIHHFFPEMKELDTISCLDDYKVLFIFDGLDECELPLNFYHNEMWCNINTPTSMDMLLTNLFKGNLLPSAYIWIISRPAAARRISNDCVHRVAEVQGFNDAQKEEYFKKTINDQALANRIITHLQSERSLYIMCHLPMFCWTASDMLQNVFCTSSGEIPKTVTEMFTRFLLIQLNTKQQKYHKKEFVIVEGREFLTKLGKLAFQMLEQDKLILNEEQWEQTGICHREAVVYYGLCTELFKEQYALYREKMYCFMHLYIQEYLAALYVFMCCRNHNKNVLEKQAGSTFSRIFKTSLLDVLKSAVDRTLQCPNGNFDMFLRFLLGLSLESNQERLRGIVKVEGGTHLRNTSEKTAQYIRKKMKENHSEERLNNLAHCLTEIQPLHSTA